MKLMKSLWFLSLFLLIFLAISYQRLAVDLLFDWDEAIYAEIGRELKFPWLDLTWNYQPWFEKPPLVSWLAKIGLSLPLDRELGARLFMPICGALVMVYTYRIARLFFDKDSALASVGAFFLLPLFLSRSRMLNCDIVLLASLVSSIFYLYQFTFKDDCRSWADYLLPAITIAVGFMAKGLMGGLVGVIWLGFLLLAAPRKITRLIKPWLLLTGLVLLLVAPWHIYMAVEHGQSFSQVYFWEQILARTQRPIEYHFGGRLYYVKFLWENLGLVLLPVVGGGLIAAYDFYKNRRRLFWLLLVWGAVVLGLFTFAKTKLFWYILPLYPVLALLLAYYSRIKLLNRFLPGLFLIAALVVAGRRTAGYQPGNLNARSILASRAQQNCSAPLAMLVSDSERQAREILPAKLQLSSSFRYGGSPAVVFYYQGRVRFFYQTEQFNKQWGEGDFDCAMITITDRKTLTPEGEVIAQQKPWQIIKSNQP